MADIISRLKLESGEFNANIKRAGQELMAYSEHCKKMGLEMGYANKDAKDFARQLGSMSTQTQSARGKINELTEAFTNLKAMYNSMTEAEKNGTFGKNLAASLDQLKQRINDSKKELDGINSELGKNTDATKQDSISISDLTSKLGINIKSLVGWGAAITASKVALDVAKDAIMSSESNVDEWGRTVAASESIYKGFLNSLNTGDISGYLSNINAIVQAAREAYNELDRLGTMKTIQSPKMSAQQTENTRMRMMLQTGRYIAPVDGRLATMEDGAKLSKAQLQAIERQLQNGMKTVTTLVGNEVKQTGKAIDAVYRRQAKELGMGIKEFRKGTSSMEEFDKRMAGYDKYKEWDKQARIEYAKQGGRGSIDFDKNNPYAQYRKWGTFRVDGKDYNDLVQLINQRDQQSAQAYQTQGQMYRTMNRADAKINGGSGKGKGGKTGDITYADDSIMAQEKLIEELTKKWKTAGDTLRDDYLSKLDAAKEKLNEMMGKAKGPDFDKLFPDMSEQNYNTGYAGSAQSIYTSAIADLAQGPLNMPSIQSFITTMQSALAEADFGTPIYNSISEKLKDATTMSTLLQELMERGMEGADLESTAKFLQEKLLSPEGIDQEGLKAWLEQLNKGIEEAGGIGMALDMQSGEVKDKKQGAGEDAMKKFSAEAGKFVGGLGEVANGLRAAGISIPQEVNELLGGINGFMQIISGFQSLISMVSTPAVTLNTAAITDLTAILGAKMLMPGFAGGGVVHAANGWAGIVPGNSLSGDNVPALLNSQEIVLNTAQTNNLANALSRPSSDGSMQPYVDGEYIFLGLSNYLERAGYGEIVTTKR